MYTVHWIEWSTTTRREYLQVHRTLDRVAHQHQEGVLTGGTPYTGQSGPPTPGVSTYRYTVQCTEWPTNTRREYLQVHRTLDRVAHQHQEGVLTGTPYTGQSGPPPPGGSTYRYAERDSVTRILPFLGGQKSLPGLMNNIRRFHGDIRQNLRVHVVYSVHG